MTEQEKQSITDELKQCKDNLKLLREKGNNVSVGPSAQLPSGGVSEADHVYQRRHCDLGNSVIELLCLGISFFLSKNLPL